MPSARAEVSINLTVEEKGTVVSFYDDYFVVNVQGSFVIENPSSDAVNSVSIPMDMHELYLNLSDVKGLHYRKGALEVDGLRPNTSRTAEYSIVGITSEETLVSENTVFDSAVDRSDIRFNMRSVGTLKKAPLEDPSKGGDPNERLISVTYRNPTDFSFLVNSVTVIKTEGMDVSDELETWEFDKEGGRINPGEVWNIDFLDDNAHEGEVYWLNVDLRLRSFSMQSTGNITRLTQDEMFKIRDNRTNATENVSGGRPLLKEQVFLTKKVSESVVNKGQTIEVVLLANNFAPRDIKGASVRDPIPDGFRVSDAERGDVSDGKIRWNNVTLNARETRRLTYELTYVENESVGLDYFDSATLKYGNTSVYTKAKPFVRSYSPEKKLFVQKDLEYLSDDEVKVSISLQNMGDTALKDVVVSDFLSSDYEFKEVSRPFAKKGKWDIDKLNRREQWEVTYVTNAKGALNTFPNVYGVEKQSVLKTVLLSNVVQTSYQSSSLRGIEVIGIVVVLLVGIVFFIPKRSLYRMIPKRKGTSQSPGKDSLESVVTGGAGAGTASSSRAQSQTPSQSPPKNEEKEGERQKRSQYLEQTEEELEKLKKDMGNE